MAIDIELDMSVDPENEISMTVDDGDEVEIGVGEAIVVKDHAILDNRDLPDQHPISAITGLEDALANIDTMLVVNITSSGGRYVADKTYAEIIEAIPNVVAVYSGSYYPFYRNEPTVNPFVTFHEMLLGGEGNTEVIEREIHVYQRDSVGVNTVVRTIPTLTSELTNDSGYITVDNVPQELFVVIFFLTGTDPLTVTTTTTAYEVAQAVQSGKALYSVLIAGASMANLTPTSLMSDNGDVLVKFAFNEQSSNIMGIRYFEISMFNAGTPSVINIKTDPFATTEDVETIITRDVDSTYITNALGYTPASSSDLTAYMQKGVDYVTAGQKSGTTLGNKATAEGNINTASGINSHAEGNNTTASGNYSHAEGAGGVASGNNAHAECNYCTASGDSSHAEGQSSTATSVAAHAEGNHTTASGSYAHAEGERTTAGNGWASHAEGHYTTASGYYAHAEGDNTIARRRSQHTFGEFNVADQMGGIQSRGNYVEIVGNGADDTHRSNARTLDWSGNEVLAGTLTVGADPTNNMEVATKQYVDGAIPTVPTNVSSFTNDAGYLVASDLTEATDADVIAIVV